MRVGRGSRVMDGKSIMGVLLLAAARGSTIAISADGADEAAALEALCQLVESGSVRSRAPPDGHRRVARAWSSAAPSCCMQNPLVIRFPDRAGAGRPTSSRGSTRPGSAPAAQLLDIKARVARGAARRTRLPLRSPAADARRPDARGPRARPHRRAARQRRVGRAAGVRGAVGASSTASRTPTCASAGATWPTSSAGCG